MNLEKDIRDITDKLYSAADAVNNERWRDAHGFIAEARALLSEVQSECFYKWHTSAEWGRYENNTNVTRL